MRESRLTRETLETKISVWINLDGEGRVNVDTGLGFFDHMLETALYYAMFDADVKASELRPVGGHHVIEDVGLLIGDAIRNALGERYSRFGHAIVPMDEALALVAIDISGRPSPVVDRLEGSVGGVSLEDLAHFIEALAWRLRASIHVAILRKGNKHHTIEAVFKALGMALWQSTRPSSSVRSIKGVLQEG